MAVRLLVASAALLVLSLAGCSDSGASADVGIHGFAFDPASLTVAKGDTVVFTNHEAAVHTATADGGAFDTGNLDEGEDYSVKLDPGTYAYHCAKHPQMRGTLVVTG